MTRETSKPTRSQEGRLRIQLVVTDAALFVASLALLQGERPDWFWWPLTTDWWWLWSAILSGVGMVLGFVVWLGYVFCLDQEPERGL